MKTMFSFLLVVMLSTSMVVQSQSTQPQFETLLAQCLKDHSLNEITRLKTNYPHEWLCNYYLACWQIDSSFTASVDQKERLLKQAYLEIEQLKKNTQALSSEVYTLEGMYYVGLISMDSQTNGPLYYKDAMTAYQRAMGLDKNNPRAALMFTIFKIHMAASMHTPMDFACSELAQDALLFKNFKPASPLNPSWGQEALNGYLTQFCSKP